MSKKHVLIAAGGTGGHLFPAQRLAEELLSLGVSCRFAGAGLATNPYFDRARIPYHEVMSATPFVRKGGWLKAPWLWFRGTLQSLKILRQQRITLVVGFGSYHTFPLLLAARLLRLPVILYESNVKMGKVNRLFAPYSQFTALQFDHVPIKGKGVVVRAPIRCSRHVPREEAVSYFHLSTTKKTLLIFGGSQGALTLNTWIAESIEGLAPAASHWQLLHFVGKNDDPTRFQALYDTLGFEACVKPFETEMEMAWSLADLVIARSGAATIAEQLHYSVPALYVPLPHATEDHQGANARAVERSGGAVLISQNLGTSALLNALHPLMAEKSPEREKMHSALKALKETSNRQNLSTLIVNESPT